MDEEQRTESACSRSVCALTQVSIPAIHCLGAKNVSVRTLPRLQSRVAGRRRLEVPDRDVQARRRRVRRVHAVRADVEALRERLRADALAVAHDLRQRELRVVHVPRVAPGNA